MSKKISIPSNEEIIKYLKNYKHTDLLAGYLPNLQEHITEIIRKAIELDSKEGHETNIDYIIQKIFGIGLSILREYNKIREEFLLS